MAFALNVSVLVGGFRDAAWSLHLANQARNLRPDLEADYVASFDRTLRELHGFVERPRTTLLEDERCQAPSLSISHHLQGSRPSD
jgi:hypothetical protein